MYIRLSVRVTCFLLFEALVEDWHVKRVASWNIVLNLITVTAVYIYEKWCYFIWQTPSCFIVHLCHLCWFCVQCFTVQVKQAIEMLVFYFGVPLLSVLPGHSGVFIPATTANDLRFRRIFYPRLYLLQLFSYLNSWERASIFPFECSVLNKGTTDTIFITSLVWRGRWLNPGPKALEASTLPLGYRGGGAIEMFFSLILTYVCCPDMTRRKSKLTCETCCLWFRRHFVWPSLFQSSCSE